MKRRALLITALAALILAAVPAPPVLALDEADRLWMVGERASADGLLPVARRALERLIAEFPSDRRVPEALLLVGRARLAAGDAADALEAFQRAARSDPKPGRPLELTFWEAEALFRLRRFAEARTAYDTVVKTDAASPFAPDALYGYAWSESELGRPEAAVEAFKQFAQTWPDHAQAPSAQFQLARTLVELKRVQEAVPFLDAVAKHSDHKLAPDARYLLGWARLETGDGRAGLADLRAFVNANPSHPQAPAARKLIQQAVVRYGDTSDLQEAYRSLMTRTPATPEGLHDASAIAARLGRPRDQEAAWRRLVREFPDHALGRRAALELASSAYKKKDWKETLSHARVASRSEDESVRAEAWLLAGEAELKLRNFASAEKAFQEASGIGGADAALRYRAMAGLGLAHEEQREWKAALSAYESVAESSPDATLRDWAKERAEAVKKRAAPPPPAEKPPVERKKPARKGGS